ncbi:MAG: binary toxin-like calcium binding domain-containing protein [Candidatus Falkowbacteria bacterium]
MPYKKTIIILTISIFLVLVIWAAVLLMSKKHTQTLPVNVIKNQDIVFSSSTIPSTISTAQSNTDDLTSYIKNNGIIGQVSEANLTERPTLYYPVFKDSDNDNFTDQEEKKYGTDPLKFDTDSDGLSDSQEVFVYFTNPLKADSDGDGVPDKKEIEDRTNPNGKGPMDLDKDEVADKDELSFKTDMFNPDTDGDGLTDGQEIFKYKTNPNNPDTDGDGNTDGKEVANGFNPNGPGKLNVPK